MVLQLVQVLGLLVGAAAGDTMTVAERAEKERKALFNAVADAVVFVRCGDAGFGSGFFVETRTVVTNRHVVDCDEKVTVFTRNGEKLPATVHVKDPVYDLALLEVSPATAPVVLTLADSDLVEVGDYAASVSHPEGGVWTFNEGLISNRYPSRADKHAGIIQTQVPLQPGSSGGPVFNRAGQVVGVTTAKLKSGDNTGFCIQSNLVRRLLSEQRNAASGQLAVSGAAGAEVHVDGKRLGTVPAFLALPAGSHALEIRKGGRTWKKSVKLVSGRVEQLFVRDEDLR